MTINNVYGATMLLLRTFQPYICKLATTMYVQKFGLFILFQIKRLVESCQTRQLLCYWCLLSLEMPWPMCNLVSHFDYLMYICIYTYMYMVVYTYLSTYVYILIICV